MRISLPTHRHGLHRGKTLLRRAPRRRTHDRDRRRLVRKLLRAAAQRRAREIEQFVNAFTVNETYFYREDHQLACLTSDLLAARLQTKPRGEQIRIWSVPCSTGEEPYSIAMWLLENWPLVDEYDIEIVGSDIDTRVLETARAGIFGKRALMRLSPHLLEKYFGPSTRTTLADPRRPAPVRAVHASPISSIRRRRSRTASST